MKIAALLTCFNRKEKTDKCLSSLFNILKNIDVYLVDDNSKDGTFELISNKYPEVKLIKGNGQLFWNRGMHLAWVEALKRNYDFYLWLNDDIELYPFFINELLNCEQYGNNQCIVSGLIEDINSKGNIIYGGSDEKKNLLQSDSIPKEIKYMNGNVVLVPKYVVNKIGILDPKFHHDLGDVDYGLTAIENGIKVFCTRIPIAAGYSNNYCRVRKWNTNIINRFKKLYSPLGSNPKINFYFRKKHFGVINATLYWFFLHIINIIPDKIITMIFGKKYIDK